MTWKKSPPELITLLDKMLLSFDCQKRMMFGYPVYFVNNNMFTGTHQHNVFLRLSESDREEILSKGDEFSPFEPVKGRIMKEYVVLPDSILNDSRKLQKWLNRSYDYVSSLPKKELKSKTKKRNQDKLQ
ncbi:MAG: TfoX/Sxy family protein [Candidatus Aminicenantes bacterium]|jgi:TfoX/Sxy family transcriptional regulator of competence genes